jgi:hypothetical protein
VGSLLKPFDMVRCYVLGHIQEGKNKNKKNISLSLRQSLVNRGIAFKHCCVGFGLYGCIASKEDHGFVCFLIRKFRFLSFYSSLFWSYLIFQITFVLHVGYVL